MNKTEQKARLKELEALSPAEVAQIALNAELKVLEVIADKEESEQQLNSGLAQTNEQLEKANDKIKELNDDLTQEKADRQAAEKAKEEAEDLNAELNEELEKVRQQKAADPNAIPEIEYQGIIYQVVIPQIRHKGQIITVKVLEESEQIVAELIEMESGMLQAKNKEA